MHPILRTTFHPHYAPPVTHIYQAQHGATAAATARALAEAEAAAAAAQAQLLDTWGLLLAGEEAAADAAALRATNAEVRHQLAAVAAEVARHEGAAAQASREAGEAEEARARAAADAAAMQGELVAAEAARAHAEALLTALVAEYQQYRAAMDGAAADAAAAQGRLGEAERQGSELRARLAAVEAALAGAQEDLAQRPSPAADRERAREREALAAQVAVATAQQQRDAAALAGLEERLEEAEKQGSELRAELVRLEARLEEASMQANAEAARAEASEKLGAEARAALASLEARLEAASRQRLQDKAEVAATAQQLADKVGVGERAPHVFPSVGVPHRCCNRGLALRVSPPSPPTLDGLPTARACSVRPADETGVGVHPVQGADGGRRRLAAGCRDPRRPRRRGGGTCRHAWARRLAAPQYIVGRPGTPAPSDATHLPPWKRYGRSKPPAKRRSGRNRGKVRLGPARTNWGHSWQRRCDRAPRSPTSTSGTAAPPLKTRRSFPVP